jgi:L-threonylcarbamoyladenylate synthase
LSAYFDMTEVAQRGGGLSAARTAVGEDRLVVVPTDTTYGVACDAFSRLAVGDQRRARGGSRSAPPAVMVPHVRTLAGIAAVNADVTALAEAFWPGALTLLCRSHASLNWDLGDTGGTVAVRMPLHPVALELLDGTGPMAVTGANRVGEPAAVSAWQAQQQLGDSVAVYLDAGPSGTGVPSTVLDCSGGVPRVLREGGVTLEELREVVPEVLAP